MYLTNLQSYIFGLFLLGIMGIVACEKNNIKIENFDFNKTLELRKAQEVWLGTDNQFKIVLEDIKDSRCPVNAYCVRAGEAIVFIKISNTEQNYVKFELSYGERSNFKSDSLDFSFMSKNYRAILSAVNPYPNTKNDQVESIAKITVKLIK